MILSFDKNFLFVKNTKIAGTSIEIALSKALHSQKDIITPISPEDETIRLKEGGRSPQNWAYPSNTTIAQIKNYGKFIKFCVKNYNVLINNPSNETSCSKLIHFKNIVHSPNKKYWNHMKVDDIIEKIGITGFCQLFSFTFIRHPFSKIISGWMYANRNKDLSLKTLSEARKEIESLIKVDAGLTQKDYCYSKKYNKFVTKIYKFEELNFAIKDICLKLEINEDIVLPLPNAKSSSRKLYSLNFKKEDILNQELKQLIYEKCRWEFENYYQF